MYILFEGDHQVGKSTLIEKIKNNIHDYLKIKRRVEIIKECDISTKINDTASLETVIQERKIIYDKYILPILEERGIILQDRGFLSTLAYQCADNYTNCSNNRFLTDFFNKHTLPNMVIYIKGDFKTKKSTLMENWLKNILLMRNKNRYSFPYTQFYKRSKYDINYKSILELVSDTMTTYNL